MGFLDGGVIRAVRLRAGLVRIPTFYSVLVPYALGRVLVSGTLTGRGTLADFCLLLAGALYSGLWNNLADFAIDQANGRGFDGTEKELRDLSRPLFILATVLVAGAVVLSPPLIFYALAASFLGAGYNAHSLRGSHRPVVGLLLFTLYYRVFPLALGLWRSGPIPGWAAAILVAMACLRASSGLFKDFRDLEGDRANGKITFLGWRGPLPTMRLSAILAGVGCLLLLLGMAKLRGWGVATGAAGIGVLALLALRWPFLREIPDHNAARRLYGRAITADNGLMLLVLAGLAWR